MELAHSASRPACPFTPADQLEWNEHGVHCQTKRIPIKPGMHHVSLKLRLDSPSNPAFEFEAPQLLVGFVSAGWAKITTGAQDVEKLESGHAFLYTTDRLDIDRTSPVPVQLQLFACDRTFVLSLLELGLSSDCALLSNFAENKSTDPCFQSSQMNAAALMLAQQINISEATGLKQRLTLEANALSWMAEVLHDDDSQAAPTKTLNADDRDAIETIIDQMHEAPGHEYSLAELCNIGAINEHKLKSAFKAIHGKTAFAYLRHVRMTHASQLLKQDRFSVIQVANEVGYSNASHFARAFKEHHGLLPKAFQCLHRR